MTQTPVVSVISCFVLSACFGFRVSCFVLPHARRLIDANLFAGDRPPRRWRSGQVVGFLKPRRWAFDAVNFREAIEPPPEVAVFDRCHAAIPFPLPVVLFPVRQARFEAAAQVAAAGYERHAGWLRKGFEAADDRQELQSFDAGGWLFVGCFQLGLAARLAEDEPPATAVRIVTSGSLSGFRVQKEMRGADAHRGIANGRWVGGATTSAADNQCESAPRTLASA
jgi:hypothetical protein